MSGADELRRAQQTLRRFQHEVRTPLGQIIGYSELVEEELEDRGQEDLAPDLQRIRSAAQRLLDLVDGKLRAERDAGAPSLPEEAPVGDGPEVAAQGVATSETEEDAPDAEEESARILVVERGDFIPQEPENWSAEAVWGQLRYRTTERWLDGNGV